MVTLATVAVGCLAGLGLAVLKARKACALETVYWTAPGAVSQLVAVLSVAFASLFTGE